MADLSEKLKLAHIKKVGTRGNLSIWVVNGTYVRDNLEIEFTNSGQHFRFNIIPEFEIWLDKEAHPDERRFFIDEALIEYKLMKEGESYDKALDIANMYSKSERMKSGDLQKVEVKNVEHPEKVHIKFLGNSKSDISVWTVDGRLVRSDFYINYTEGGHDLVYKFVPKNEVWIDNDLSNKEIPFVLIHELHERNLMHDGLTYHEAHVRASHLEWKCRNGIEDTVKVLQSL